MILLCQSWYDTEHGESRHVTAMIDDYDGYYQVMLVWRYLESECGGWSSVSLNAMNGNDALTALETLMLRYTD